MSLLGIPHHDGSPLYLADEAPHLGNRVTVRLRTSADDPVERAWVRTTYDAEPTYHEMVATSAEPGGEESRWWSGELPVHNPVTHYRFLIERADGTQTWLTAAGEVGYDGSDTFDFKVVAYAPAPAWARDGVVYQIFPDRFARSEAADGRETPAWAVPAEWDDTVIFEATDPRTPLQLFGGDLDGVVEHLDHLEETGADIVYTTPVFPGESNHRYNASTFDHVDPLLGGDKAYQRLSEAVHRRGWRLLGDLTSNHTGDTHEWFQQAREGGETRGWYYFHDEQVYESWMGHHTLPKLDHTNDDLRREMIEGPTSVVGRWLRPPYDVDGWRIDVANMTGRLGHIDVNHDVARIIRATAAEQREDTFVVGEHNHDASSDIDGDGWHGTMNYSGFSWPVWSWVRAETTDARPFGRPVAVPRRPGHLVRASLDEWRARYGWRATTQSWNILSSHDSARIRTLVRDPAVHRVAVGLQFTLPGVPMLFAGDEIGLEGVNGEDGRRPMPWHHRESWDTATLRTYGALASLRREHVALRRGGLRWAYVDDDSLVYLREHPDGTILVAARRAAGTEIALDLPAGDLLLSTAGDASGFDGVVPATDAPAFTLWRLTG
ncbi:glycoside hydrolase family 13 protein [Nocardioides sp. CER19]|uniref:glycoside hydrolase family 13 protein n=1 Tax=Nocardioides sp. CER19 TaxID=3038538 RepID=UPI00244AE09F|nr:glycoside hydrolase family 13 protein [Nocardioides sp. CER19]MDH2413413.1 glycoside hydrolase family 13 protein [Nocardioides sp. CER19]